MVLVPPIDQAAKREWRQLVVDEGDGRTIAGEDTVRRNEIRMSVIHALGGELGFCLSQRPSLHQRFRLRQAIGDEKLVLVAQFGLETVGCDRSHRWTARRWYRQQGSSARQVD